MSLFRLFVSRSSHHSASFGKCFFFVAVRTGVFVLQIGFLFLPSSVGHLFYHSRTPHRATLIFLLFTSPPPRSGILNATFSPYALCSPLCFLLPLLFRYLVLISFERFPLSYSLLRFSSFAHRAFPSPRVRVYTYILGYTTNTYVLTLALHAKNDVAYTALLAFFFFLSLSFELVGLPHSQFNIYSIWSSLTFGIMIDERSDPLAYRTAILELTCLQPHGNHQILFSSIAVMFELELHAPQHASE